MGRVVTPSLGPWPTDIRAILRPRGAWGVRYRVGGLGDQVQLWGFRGWFQNQVEER